MISPPKCAIYTRLSKEDEDKQQPESESIQNQDPSQTTLEPWERFCFGMMELGKRIGLTT